MLPSSLTTDKRLVGTVSADVPRSERAARYVMIRMEGGGSDSALHWGFGRIEIVGAMDGLAAGTASRGQISPMVRSIDPTSRAFTPTTTTSVRVAVYSSTGRLMGTMKARDPSRQRGILEQSLLPLDIADYSDDIWSATLPYSWVEEGNVVVIGCVDEARPDELLVRRLELRDLARFGVHTITR